MNTKLSRTILSAALLVGAFALAGCGGGDDTVPEDPGGMTDADKLAAEKDRADKAEQELEAEKKRQADEQAAADAKAMNAMAMKLSAGLSVGDSVTVTSLAESALAGTFDANGTEEPAADTDALSLKASDAVVAALAGWDGADYVDTTKGVTNHAVVYSNQGAPKREAFEVKHESIITVSGSVPQGSFGNLKITGSGFRTLPGSTTHEAPGDADYVSVRGTLDGAPGSFRCDSEATCTSSGSNVSGTTLSEGWHFIADDGAMTSTPDDEYVSYGWWARDDGNTVAVAAFYDTPTDDDVTTTTGITDLSGKATYMGGAAGKVAVYSPVSDSNVAGAFTASAELTADFGATGSSDGGTIEGTISNFSVGGAMQEGWSVALKSSSIATGGSFGGDTATTEWTIDGAKGTGNGTYSGQFYEAGESGLPLTAAGRFTGKYGSVGSMVGAFGAKTSE